MAGSLPHIAASEVQAVERSHLRSLPAETLARIVADPVRLEVDPGGTIHREGDTEPHMRLVVSGLVRVYATAPDGRTMTVRYCRPGALLGVVSLFASPFVLPVSIQAITRAELLGLRPGLVREAADRDVRVARALIAELSERVLSFVNEIPGNAFATVRQRVIRHLIDLASDSQEGPALVVSISQQHLADSVGTVREVVARALRELREAGLIRTERDRIVLLDPERLVEEGYSPGPYAVAHGQWNMSH